MAKGVQGGLSLYLIPSSQPESSTANPSFICLSPEVLAPLQEFLLHPPPLPPSSPPSLSEPKMLSKSSDLPQKSLQLRQDNKFYTRLLSKESSLANPSFRVYYGVATGSVPFLWESQPGTPKHIIPTTTLPPLTPPPSYHSSNKSKSAKKSSKSNLIHAILPCRLNLRKAHAPSSLSVSLSSSSVSSSSSSSSPLGSRRTHQRRRSSSQSLSFSSRGDDEESDDGSPTSTLCFRIRHGSSCRLSGRHSVVNMKNTSLPIVGHGSSQGTDA